MLTALFFPCSTLHLIRKNIVEAILEGSGIREILVKINGWRNIVGKIDGVRHILAIFYRTGKLLLLNLKFTEYGIFKPKSNGIRDTQPPCPFPNGPGPPCFVQQNIHTLILMRLDPKEHGGQGVYASSYSATFFFPPLKVWNYFAGRPFSQAI